MNSQATGQTATALCSWGGGVSKREAGSLAGWQQAATTWQAQGRAELSEMLSVSCSLPHSDPLLNPSAAAVCCRSSTLQIGPGTRIEGNKAARVGCTPDASSMWPSAQLQALHCSWQLAIGSAAD